MQRINNYNQILKRTLFAFCLLMGYHSGYSQLAVQAGMNSIDNEYSASLCVGCPSNEIAQDLFFSIGPGGVPQYGRNVSWNLNQNTFAKARFYHVKKGHWGSSAIRTSVDDVDFTSSAVVHSPENTPNVNMGDDWIKIGKSWNFSHDNYAIAIISFTNKGESVMDKGTIKFSHEMLNSLQVAEIMIYNDWVHEDLEYIENNRKVLQFKYDNLRPNEIRYLYVKIDIAKSGTFKTPSTSFEVEMTGFQNASLDIGGGFPPHDPNELTLVTALDNTPPLQNCSAYASFPDLQEACEKGQPFWISCPNEGDLKCPLAHSLNYPFCNNDSEMLTYRIDCLNEGMGVAKNIEMINTFGPTENPFDPAVFSYSSSHTAVGSQNYPQTRFSFKPINLPGLLDPYYVYTYDECSASATFTVKTICNINISIGAETSIIFVGTNDVAEDPIITNTVTIVPEQGVYNNYDPSCESCGIEHQNRSGKYVPNDLKVLSANSLLELTFNRESKENDITINIFDLSGRVTKSLQATTNGSTSVFETIDLSNLRPGMYFLSIQDGSKRYVEKFIHY